ncbi:MAG: galactose-1-phosphate uridylyltransferase [Terriglobia bacterium]
MSELRKDPVTGRWVIIATDRAKRPNDFVRDKVEIRGSGFCPFCYNNESKTPPEILVYPKDGRAPNTPGWTLRVVANKFPALGIEGGLNRQGDGVYDKMEGIGAHEVVIETPDHQKTLAQLSLPQIEDVLWAFHDRIIDLKRDHRFKYILIFKNHGEAAGASLEHTHSQLIALPVVPKRVSEEIHGAEEYFNYKDRCIYCDIVLQEAKSGVRMIAENERFVAISPFAARFPFETWILPKTHESSYEQLMRDDYAQFAVILKDMLSRLDRVLENPAYNYVIHTSPLPQSSIAHYHWHMEIMPKLTKVAGFEWGTGFYINPTSPEVSAKFLREAAGAAE